ncbi:hypothetical protein SMACR_00486 [Sordaria macrospora]|uniref:WGS project CABT00000000 data, contig 2.1 n=2 Tax=Sordaria macrospora TaxID=5147 RepID=F7VL92_SORMK|nr:uncharacterized protein SMAC_00486 [Sordaria macrospora k-hell]KAA8635390.1 hypothetical protein SMACR_00486 [Sordaria macrospora]WPJ59237.1 hypothetical protein SMAC4_00486 [Sordaria macrospora]CCC06269.1 unnamed protein product [Sordaria macrospora k-hell]
MSQNTGLLQVFSRSGTSSSSQRSGQGPESFGIQMELLVPTRGFRIVDDQDRELKTIVEQIEYQHGVRIRLSGQEDPILISAASPKEAREAMSSILKSLVLREGHATVWQDSILIAPPRGDRRAVRILLQEGPGTTWFRPAAAPTGSGEVADALAVKAYKRNLTAAMVRVGDGLRYSPNRMRMRIGFGKLFFKERKKGTTSYTLDEFSKLARRVNNRGTSYMEMRLGGESMREQIQQAFSLDADFGDPQGKEDSVIVTVKNVNLEVSVDGTQDGRLTLGALNVFHREKSHRSVDLATACPDKKHDWVLKVESPIDETDSKLPLDQRTLNNGIKIRRNPNTNCIEPHIAASFAQTNHIEALIGKTTWSYFLNKEYIVEISLYQQWSTLSAGAKSQQPVAGVSVAMYRPEWSDSMAKADVSAGPRPWETFPKQFFDSSRSSTDPTTGLDPVAALLHWVGKVQTLLDTIV